jgi:hypothetical protein
MVNGGLKSLALSTMRPVPPGRVAKCNLAAEAALTNRTDAVRCHQKLFWPGRFMVY